jgi:hypothetical protein
MSGLSYTFRKEEIAVREVELWGKLYTLSPKAESVCREEKIQ